MSRSVWVNAANGLAGDMLLGALVDAGADRLAIMDAWGALQLDGYAATWETVQRCGVRSLWTNIVIHGDDDHPHRPAAAVIELIESADLDPEVGAAASGVYRRLAAVEAQIHGTDTDTVELHEVGALDSILDIVGVSAALHNLGVESLSYSPISVGTGTVRSAHGTMPSPAPAVAGLLAAANAAVVGVDTDMELATPTGVALVTTLGERCGPPPAMTVVADGFGAGTADPPDRANVTHVLLGEPARPHVTDDATEFVIDANVDDATGEVIAHTIAVLLDAGARDAWATPIVMKKGRPAVTVSVLCTVDGVERMTQLLLNETGSLGARRTPVEKVATVREYTEVELDGHRIGIKHSPTTGRLKVEHDDARRAALALGRPFREVLIDAEALARSRSTDANDQSS